MNSGNVFKILSLVVVAIAFGCSFVSAIALPKDTDSIAGVVTEFNPKDVFIRINTEPYYFKDVSIMDTMLKERKISSNQKVIVFYKKDGGKKLVVNIEINKRKDLY
jgi:hypothetical protein